MTISRFIKRLLAVPVFCVACYLIWSSFPDVLLPESDPRNGTATILAVAGFMLISVVAKYLWFGDWRDRPASQSQKTYADSLGIEYHPEITKREMSKRLNRLFD